MKLSELHRNDIKNGLRIRSDRHGEGTVLAVIVKPYKSFNNFSIFIAWDTGEKVDLPSRMTFNIEVLQESGR